MKKLIKILSVVCVLAIIISVSALPYGVNAVSIENPEATELHNVIATEEEGETVYCVASWKANSVTFDYKIEAGYIYCLSFDYKGTNRFDSASAGQALKASTVKSKTDYLNDAVENAVVIGLSEYSEAYKSVWCELSGDDLLESGGCYLALNWKHLTENSYFKSFKIVKLAKSFERPRAACLHNVAVNIEDGEIVYGGSSWNAGSITFDYEIESGYSYYIRFDYKGHNWAQRQTVMASTLKNTETGLNDTATSALSLNVPANSRESYKSVSVKLSGDDLLKSGGKYLVFNWVEMGDPLYFKNIAIYRVPNDGYENPVTVSNGVSIEYSGETAFYAFDPNGNSQELRFDCLLEAGKTYAVNFSCILNGSEPCDLYFAASKNPFAGSSLAKLFKADTISATGEKKSVTLTFKADDIITDTEKYFTVCTDGFKSSQLLKIGEFTVGEINPEALLVNGGFEAGKIYWEDAESCAAISSDSFTGDAALHLSGGCYSTVSSHMTLKTDSAYKLTFKYKGSFTGIPNWGISPSEGAMNADMLAGCGSLSDSEIWKDFSFTFSSGAYTDFYVVFQTGDGCDFYIDDVSVEETDEVIDEAYSAKTPEYTLTEADNRFWHWDAKSEEENLVKNGSFDGEGGNWSSLLSNGTVTLVESESAKSGSKMLKFEAHDLNKAAKNYLYVACEANTEYILSVWHKGEKRSDTNKNDMRWGIADPLNGSLIYTSKYLKGYNLSCWDNEWHRTTLKFNSGNSNIIVLAYVGADSTAYIDDLQIFKYSDRVNGRPAVMTQKRPDVTENSPEKTVCDSENNLFENSDFEAEDTSFWSGEDSMGYKGTVSQSYTTVLDWDGTAEIVDTHSSHGNALYYTANDKYTGYPLSTSYIKYIDVEPNTEYTFAADFCIEKAGKGRFGLLAVNDFYPREITTWQSFSEENFDDKYNWQTVSYSFNSNEYTRLAFCLQDKGGAAYIDNIRLFKSSDGKAEEKWENSQKIESDKYTVTGGTIKFGELTVSISEVLESLNIKSGIKVFDRDGNEITALKAPVTPGMQFKYMDGITVFDSVTAEIIGDINSDGYVDIRDLVRLKKILAGLMSDGELKADFDSNGKTDSADLILLKKRLLFG